MVARPSGAKWAPDGSTFPPSGSELAQYLAELSDYPEADNTDLAKVAQYFEVVAAGRTPLSEHLTKLLRRDFEVGPIHQLLAEMKAPMLVVTTNYDELLERAFQAASKPFDLVVHTTDRKAANRVLLRRSGARKFEEVPVNRLDVNARQTSVIYKMHGTVATEELESGHFVVTEDDYVDFLTRMTKRSAIPAVIAEHFQDTPFLFLGYGLRDWNFRVVLSHLHSDWVRVGGTRSWAIQRQPALLEQRLWQHRGIELFDQPIDEFVNSIRK